MMLIDSKFSLRRIEINACTINIAFLSNNDPSSFLETKGAKDAKDLLSFIFLFDYMCIQYKFVMKSKNFVLILATEKLPPAIADFEKGYF